MSTKHVRNPDDLVRFGCSLKITCDACGAAHTMTGIEVAKIHPVKASLDLLRPRFKCRRCRMKVANIAVLPPV